MSPFDFANSINHTKEDLIVDERTEKEYNPFIVNRAMGFGKDTIIAGNEMNARPHLDNKLQYDFLRSVVRKAKRYNKWLKAEEENIEAIQEFFGYSFIKAKEALSILTETEIDLIKLHLNTSKGGKV
ncbi:MAG: DNA polymerase [Flavobacteriales bacterium]|nr:DNA polymerase [Flavobacteriales bacterium]